MRFRPRGSAPKLAILFILGCWLAPAAYAQNGPSGIVSDDFSAAALDTGLWTFIDPVGDSSLAMTGAQLALSVPGGLSHEVWIRPS